jgi:phage tail-like protein
LPETADRNDPFLAFRFEVELDNFTVSAFSECSGLQIDTEVQDYAEGGLNTYIHKFPGRTKQVNLQLKRGIVDRKVWDWYYDVTQGKVVFRNGSVRVFDAAGAAPVMEWHFHNSFPCKWVGPSLNAAQSAIAVEVLEICHQGLERTQ